MLLLEDAKVIGANVICMIMLSVNNLNQTLQTILFLATITYTIFRAINEIKKFKYKRYDNNQSA
jgi:hypothetical protein